MSQLCTPDSVSFDRDSKMSVLAWNDPDSQKKWGGKYWMRGGICWPREYTRTNPEDPTVIGVALVVGQRQHDERIVVFENEKFIVVDHVLDEEGGIQHKGLSTWLNKQWASYFIDTYYCADQIDVFMRYQAQVIRSELITPKPHFVQIRWPSWEDARHIMWTRLNLRQLNFRSQEIVHTEVQKLKDSDKERKAHPAILALLASMTGIEQRPPRRRDV